MSASIRFVDLSEDTEKYARQFVGCVILTHDNKILLQQRGEDWSAYPGYLCEFGGHIETGEAPLDTLCRELKEELGAAVRSSDVVSFGALTEQSSNFSELIYMYFWHDKDNTITGCYEGEPRYFDRLEEALQHKKMTDGVRWLLTECHRLGYI